MIQTEILARLEARLAVLEANEAVRELRARYAWHAARGDYDGIAALFAPDGAFEFTGLGERRTFVGRDAIRAMLSQTMTPQMVFPFIHNDIIKVDGDRAVSTCTMDTNISPGRDHGLIGYYHDDLRRIDGVWLFERRRWFLYHPTFEESGLDADSNPAPSRTAE
ncbi:MAG: nuclear transport factor 2 family protein [Janthinobacterium lividum]